MLDDGGADADGVFGDAAGGGPGERGAVIEPADAVGSELAGGEGVVVAATITSAVDTAARAAQVAPRQGERRFRPQFRPVLQGRTVGLRIVGVSDHASRVRRSGSNTLITVRWSSGASSAWMTPIPLRGVILCGKPRNLVAGLRTTDPQLDRGPGPAARAGSRRVPRRAPPGRASSSGHRPEATRSASRTNTAASATVTASRSNASRTCGTASSTAATSAIRRASTPGTP